LEPWPNGSIFQEIAMPEDDKINPLKERLLMARIKRIVREAPPDLLPLLDEWVHAIERKDFRTADAAMKKLTDEIQRRRA
jgi:hypothetical protein